MWAVYSNGIKHVSYTTYQSSLGGGGYIVGLIQNTLKLDKNKL